MSIRARITMISVCLATIGLPLPAHAACHIAAFTQTQVEVSEKAGQVELTVELRGGNPTCSGSVRYQTENGSAEAPGDYTARSGELVFTAGDDRRESFTIPIIDDVRDEGRERFTVRLTGGSGNITPDPEPATVFIADDDEPSPTPAVSSPSPSPKPSPTASASVSPTSSPTATATSTASPTGTATPTASETPTQSPRTDAAGKGNGGSGAGSLIVILTALLAAGGGVGFWLWRTRSP